MPAWYNRLTDNIYKFIIDHLLYIIIFFIIMAIIGRIFESEADKKERLKAKRKKKDKDDNFWLGFFYGLWF